ncbi:AMP-binding protein [Undibacter mobilis]|uniref:Long-chain fatty acid--CoA ligase n=1 Tax=Undibacter mobilis TaxID=2292256 RepID=A0A371B0T7_9BRAD|nr:class I adenylate-forming enzyme family protein [Undibacter mobilis]RDV01152.1 long-chain fatty acid--CoA ligase [Undibacter mobilis]
MILRNETGANESDTGTAGVGRPTLDDLFRRAAVHDPDALALADPPNRSSFTDGAPRRLTYAQADRAISALAAKFCRAGLQADTLVAIQLPNTVEAIITLLAVLRAGMIAVPLPVLWRQKEILGALRPLGVKAIVTASRIGAVKHAELAGEVGAELFPIRFICGFGGDLPDGVLTLDDVFDTQTSSTVPRTLRGGQAAEHVAVVTLDVTPAGLVPVARSHSELIAGGLSLAQEIGVGPHMSILAAIPPSSFAGLAVTIVPWLFGGGCLSLHHGFDAKAFGEQMGTINTAVLPGPAVALLAKAGRLQVLKSLVAVWRSPEQLNTSAAWSGPARLTDVSCFGELGAIAVPRDTDGLPAAMPLGPVGAPHDIETARSKIGTLLVRGAMVPRAAFPPGVEHGPEPYLAADKDGFVDTGFTCRADEEARTLTVSGPPGGIAAIGGYRFTIRDMESQVSMADPAATIVALPGSLMAQKLAGSALDNADVAVSILGQGGSPLIAAAFRPRGLAA